MRIIKIISGIIRYVEKPILREIPFFMWLIFLLIFPTLINAYWVNGKDMLFSDIQMKNRFGAAFPYILFMPFVIAYFLVVIQVICRKKLFKVVIYCILFFLMLLNLFLLFNFSTMISPMMFTLLSETTGQETSGFISTYLFSRGSLITVVIGLVMACLIWLTEKCSIFLYNMFAGRSCVMYPVLFAIIYLFYRGVPCLSYYLSLFSCRTPEDVEEWSYGFKYDTNTVSGVIYSLFDFRSQQFEVNHFYKMMSNLKMKIDVSDVDTVDVVFVIGESYNKYHAGIYGYGLNTTPFMAEQYEKGNLVIFDDVVSPSNMTSFVVKNLLSTNSVSNHERWSDYPFFPILFKNSGFSVYFWDNQMVVSRGDVYDFSLNALIHNNDISSLSYTMVNNETFLYDGDLIDNFIKNVHLVDSKNLVILHLQGQHFEAKDKYPHDCGYDIFTVNSYNKPSLSLGMLQKIADYDNATRYNDDVIKKIVDIFNDRKAVMVYVSDHGEEVYDYREFIGRTHEENKSKEALKYQYDVPLVIWFSDKYLAENKDVVQSLSRNAHKRAITDDISHLILGLGRLETSYYDSNRDLSSKDYKERKRIVQNSIDYDKQILKK